MVMGSLRQEAELVVVGSGPGGYVAALRAADLGREVVLIEAREALGGVCLLEGCIPSKTLIHAAEIVEGAKAAEALGLRFAAPEIDLERLRRWTDGVVNKLSGGVAQLLKRRGVEVIHGRARLQGPNALSIQGAGVSGLDFKRCILATGSRVTPFPDAEALGIWSSRQALALPEIPRRLLLIGGGYIGLELGLVYAGLGAEVTLVEFAPSLLQGADSDLVEVVIEACQRRFAEVLMDSKVTHIARRGDGYTAQIQRRDGEIIERAFDKVMAAVGRRPNTDDLGLETVGIEVTAEGFIPIDARCQTQIPSIFAIGDITPGPMLAHKASRQAKVAAEFISGEPSAFDNRAIPAVVFTDPEIAWTGLTETEARASGRPIKVGRFPLTALGRARTLGRAEGLVKVISDPDSHLILGVGMVGSGVSELIAEGTLALEMGARLEDLMVTIHPHPTMSEAIMEAAEVAAGSAVHLPKPR
ncbi:dihydrolipoyl dehydrogenase [Myxococcota bacterium]|nr:dihydrolipoyl dehydrogenase [Myxococcota bacterium]MBU1431842.1 dihydrolipoyl dehydrogenase [Myxococcota bacterium]MBU1899458.1 dihydrolipoyl dehydrogenase [Myxococcota bacterium]